jgi:hypothetical protein
MQIDRLQPQFVQEIPLELQPGVLYVSMEFATAQHLCPCGCASEVVTPLHPTRWRLTYDGESVSLHPSVGSGSLPCRSHYFIRDNGVQWVRWSEEEAERARHRDCIDTEAFFAPAPGAEEQLALPAHETNAGMSFGQRAWNWVRRRRSLDG